MRILSSLITALAVGLVPATLGQIISYTPSLGRGVSYSVNIPDDTASAGSGPIYMQLTAPSDLRWMALGQGSRMTHGNLFIVYSASADNVTLSTRKALGHYEPVYDSEVEATLLDGSGIVDGVMTANIRCDNCMHLFSGKSIMGSASEWVWAVNKGAALYSTNVSQHLTQHDWHGIFSLDLTLATGGDSANPFASNASYSTVNYSSKSKQQQISDTILHKKRIAHGVMTSVAFVLLFPNFALTLFIFPSRYTVPWIHAPLQLFGACLALAGFGVGVSVSRDLQELGGYHPSIGYVAVGGVVVLQPILGIIQHIKFRRTRKSTWFGVAHRWLGRGLAALGTINGGVGFYYARAKNPDIPPASPIAYGVICAVMFLIYVSVIWWRKSRDKAKAKLQIPTEKVLSDTDSGLSGRTACEEV
ncbi:hypothetical protein ASPZODRAFT_152120 [Penicilliopsis zonata CBS 506.65]|uniref:Cellobiose dehydrogenase-like cytochrome domain-containing protein n=1 Tax=Penicilliopsis zonata CBS 506.65 TaxID=1073090 RepID=A0A1L9SHS9_9EURO|nr:hypothetical protein ASPZODRAFT_152120 [Penicilliopsis zonata CBS 506.65]OJJ46673.1 hypothetical protein ASPZODRAFT_152120 [Penicilliopsis zonata CBS 506.65]